MARVIKCGKRERISYARTTEVIDLPDLIEVQTKSYEWFLKEGLREALEEVFPIEDYTGKLQLDFVSY